MVYVLSNTGTPLMPTERYGKVRRMLRDGLAVVVRREPFTVRLIDGTKVHAGTNCKKLQFLSVSRSFLTTKKRNGAIPPPAEVGSILAHFS